ncbi:PI31 proteasome regulator N-terminal-domain-containing protein [Tirmania nivea]|nr:PI31 proteasome regulator N-terminal-domain-containing protein [Tirmania nivea]
MTDNPLSPATLLSLIEGSLWKPSSESSSARPQTLRNPYDAIALFVHACMLTVGFRLIGLDDDDKLDTPIDTSNLKPLLPKWNSGSSYSFRYAHSQSSLEYLIKINRLGNKVVIFGLGIGDEKTTSFDIVTRDFISESFFPYTPNEDEGDEENGGLRKKLKDAFISQSRIADLASLVKINIIQKLMPGLNKPGYQEEFPATASTSASQSQRSPQRLQEPDQPEFNDPLRMGFHPPRPFHPRMPPPMPAGEEPPGFEDEYEILRPPRHLNYPPGRNPLSIGADDLNPPGLGPNPPLRGPFFGEGGIPRPGFGGMGPMGGMHPTPNHPMFGGGNNGNGQGENDQRFPPGSRYDPVGPGDAPRGGLRGPRGPGWGGYGGFGSGDFI